MAEQVFVHRGIAVVTFAAVLAAGAGSAPAAPPVRQELVYYDYLDEHGRLAGGRVMLDVAEPVDEPAPVWNAEALRGGAGERGAPANRLYIVTVGDGYTAGQLGAYAAHAQAAVDALFEIEPFATYEPLFEVYRVDVISPESGVDHDTSYPTWRNTALDMGYWCNGTERLLCVNVGKAQNAANAAPRRNLVLAIANSSKYGGAGYPGSALATVAGANGAAADIAIHEFGHGLGKLADEYDYGGPATYTGPERSERNVSILTAAQMAAQGKKWAAWLGQSFPGFDGLVSTYEGAHYSAAGIYRPTNNSMMRNLGRPFNMPSVEALIIEIYKVVRPIDGSSHPGQFLSGCETVWVQPVQPIGHSLEVRWLLDGAPIEGATGTSLTLSTIPLEPGRLYDLQAVVTDPTPWVRDEAARAQWMTESRHWIVSAAPGPDFNRDGAVDVADFSAFRTAYLSGDLRADYTEDGVLTAADFAAFRQVYLAGCP